MPKKVRPQTRVMYIEQKTDGNRFLQHQGPAEIGEVTFSRSGKAIYYRGRSFARIPKGGIYGNFACIEDENEYWISGVKARGSNRHIFGSGPVLDTTNPGVTREPLETSFICSGTEQYRATFSGRIEHEHPGYSVVGIRCLGRKAPRAILAVFCQLVAGPVRKPTPVFVYAYDEPSGEALELEKHQRIWFDGGIYFSDQKTKFFLWPYPHMESYAAEVLKEVFEHLHDP